MDIYPRLLETGVKKTRQLIRRFYQLIYWLVFNLVYEEIHPSCFVSTGAVMRTKRSIKLGRDCMIRKGSSISGRSVELGKNVRLGFGSHIFGGEDLVQIGDDVMVGPNVIIAGGYHGSDRSGVPMVFQKGKSKGPIIIGNDVWIGGNSVVLSDITIGEGVIVGAGSVVTEDIPDYAVVAGNPARIIKYREE